MKFQIPMINRFNIRWTKKDCTSMSNACVILDLPSDDGPLKIIHTIKVVDMVTAATHSVIFTNKGTCNVREINSPIEVYNWVSSIKVINDNR